MPATSSTWRRPGRVVALAAVVALVLAGLATMAKLSQSSRIPLGSNGVGVGAVIAALEQPGDRVCLSDVVVPEGTGSVALWLGYHDAARPVTLGGVLRLRGGTSVPVQRTQITSQGGFQELPLQGVVGREARGQLCLTRQGAGPALDIGGATVSRRAGEVPAVVKGVSLAGNEPSVQLYAAPGVESSRISRLGDGIAHLSALSPSGFPPALIGLVLFGLVPVSLILLLWNLATAPHRTARRVGVWCAVASLGITFTWATVTPIFQGPDESEHFAYAQYLAETGNRAAPGRDSARPPYSTQENAVYSVLRHNAVVIDRGARNPFTATTRRDINDTDDLPRNDGGGFTESASGHSALYYAVLAPFVKLGGDALTAQLYFARLATAVMAALIAGLAAWAAALLVPGRRRVAALAGLAVATLPIAGSVGGTVNNDILVNLVAAAAFVGVIAVLTDPKGSLRRFAVLGALIAVLPIAKGTGLGVGLAFGGALVVAAVLRRSPLAILKALVAGAAGTIGALAVMAAVSELFVGGQTLTLLNIHPPDPRIAPGVPLDNIYRVDYLLQTFVPFIHLKTDLYVPPIPLYRIYVFGTWGGFGWNRFYMPTSVNMALGAATVVALIAGFWALYRERARIAGRKLAILAVALTPLIAIAFVAVAYATNSARGIQPEQGRYLMIALVPIGLWFAAVPAAVRPGPMRSALTGLIAGGLCAMTLVGLLVATGGWVA